jgi:TetR/AcrR family transcriptional regulator, repressor for uid operon
MPRLNEKSQLERRERILDAAERRFADAGFHRTSMHDICREAGISPGALYIYFTSKEELIAGICEREKSALAGALAAVGNAPDFMAALSAFGETYCVNVPPEKLRLHVEINAEAVRNPAIGGIVRAVDDFVLRSFERLIREAQREGRVAPAIEAALIAELISVIGDGLYLRRALNPDVDCRAILPVILSLLSSLIKPAAGEKPNKGAPGAGI